MSRLTAGALVFTLPAALIASTASAQEVELPEIVIYANQVPLEASKVGSAVTVVTEQQIRERGQTTLTEVLRSLPGIALSQPGGRGSNTQVRLRGAEGNHVLVLIDGVQANSLADAEFNFADILTEDVERIEVIRGPQSGLYGAAAHAGVISIVTKSGRGQKGTSLSASVEAGTQGTLTGSALLRGGHGPVYGSIGAQAYRTDGYNISRLGSEDDGSSAAIVNGKLGFDLGSHWNVEGSLRYTDRRDEFDGTASFGDSDYDPGGPTDGYVLDRDNVRNSDSALGRVAATFTALDGNFRNITSADFLTESSNTRYGAAAPSIFQGDRQTYTNKTSYSFGSRYGERQTLTAVVDYQVEEFQQDATDLMAPFWITGQERDRTGIAGEYLVDLPFGTTVSAAVRHDWNDDFEDSTTWRLAASHRLEKTRTRFHGSVGTGITNPGFFEQYGYGPDFIGNPGLKPEESLGFDIGVEQGFLDNRLLIDVTYFQSRLEDEIVTVFSPINTVRNLDGTSDRKGVEVTATFSPVDWIDLSANYTYTLSEQPFSEGEISTEVLEIRRPRHTGSLYATARFLEGRARLTLGAAYTGDQTDTRFTNVDPFSLTVVLPAYTLVSAKIDYDVTKQVTAFARAENILDEDHEDAFSYQGAGFAAYAGLKVRLGD
ncbi:TonB-dependent receptor [Agaricicola taiwanensis]|uniref:TonB-dependent receptor n=1 Tax=Agaricicola taiwanensis TaxID=591372 RepID=A0A8J2YK02_9RHOB|nr:TonB-dependent receptor [Agaricicola taiwanensis]GGE47748.1 TonB-dependent receptor [Agaricicola taiwanensis]